MCGRYTLSAEPALVAEHFGVASVPAELKPRYNIAPSQPVPVVRRDGAGPRHLELLRWGLIPSWAKDAAIGHRLINARAETLAVKPAFRTAFRRRRCLIAADGFYEWKKLAAGKQPYWVGRRDHSPFAFAGLWERWVPSEGGAPPIESCVIVTTEPNAVVRPVYNRMPVIVPPVHYDTWLDGETDAAALQALLVPYPAEEMTAYPVAAAVNNPAHDAPQLMEPVAPSAKGGRGEW
jgi:putative SOS response-associated peptidase YedK